MTSTGMPMGSLRMKAAVLLLLRLSLEKTTVAATPCGTDADCPYGASGWRCCGASLRAENCPPPANESAADVGPCVLPGTTGRTMCTCVPGRCGDSRHYKPKIDGQRQWLMIGDSISMGCVSSGLPNVSASHGIQLVHSPGNAANVWWGAHCLDGWIGDASRWDVITFQFGLHDLALDNERIEPDVYATYFANISQRIATLAPKAKLIWVTTTPVPIGIDGKCNKTNGQGGCPPRRNVDPPIYNEAAEKAVHSVPAAMRIKKLDLYSVVTKKCGVQYNLCPEGCTENTRTSKGTCYQIPHNVHYEAAGWGDLSSAYMAAVLKELF